MTRQRVLLTLYLIGVFRTTLLISLRERFYILLGDIRGTSIEGTLDRQIINGLYTIFIEFLIIISIYLVTRKEPSVDLIISNPKFRKEVSIHSLIYLLGNLTLTMILLILFHVSGISSAMNFHGDILSLFGLVDFNYLYLDTPFILINEIKYFLVSLVWGIFSGIYTILILIAFNLLHSQSQSNDGEILYPVK